MGLTIPKGFGIGSLIAEKRPRSKGGGTLKHPVGLEVMMVHPVVVERRYCKTGVGDQKAQKLVDVI